MTVASEHRATCIVDGCARTHTASRPGLEWICAKHWSMVPKHLKREHVKAKADVRKIRKWPSSAANDIALRMARERSYAAWDACVAAFAGQRDLPQGLDEFLVSIGLAD